MKKLTIFAALCALVLGSCAENNLDGVTPENNITLPDLTAGFAEDETKTYVHNNTYLRWHEADLITAFYGNSLNRQYKFKGKTGDNSGTFSLIPSGELGTGNDLGAIYAVYPYDENAGINDETRVISLTLPATQTYAENSFGKGANTMIAVTENLEDTFLGFKNACGYLKLKLYGEDVTLASVEVKGNNGEKIAGSATVTMEFGGVPALTMSADATTTVTLDCGEGVVLGTSAETATELWIVLPETTFEDGITITATDTESKVFEKSTTKTVAIVRNEIQPMAAVESVCVQPNNKICYAATQKVEPYDKTVFGTSIVSNEWNSATGEGIITFDGDVTEIGNQAFYHCESLTSVTIPDSVTMIGDRAFYMSGLKSVTIGNSVTTIGDEAFYWCDLTNVTIPDSVTTIGNSAFHSCESLTSVTIPDSVTTIGHEAFGGCSSLTSVTIPDSVTTIAIGVFDSCSSLTSVYCKATTPPTLGYYVFDSNASGRKIYVPTESIEAYKAAEKWSEYAADIVGYDFETGEEVIVAKPAANEIWYTTTDGEMAELKSHIYDMYPYSQSYDEENDIWIIKFEDSVAHLYTEGIFPSSSNVKTITLPNSITYLPSYAFALLDSLTNITIPDSVTSIDYSAFEDCSSLTSITIPNSVTSIGERAFEGCSSLSNVVLGNSVKTIGCSAFKDCASGMNINIPASVENLGCGTNHFCICSNPANVRFESSTPPATLTNHTFFNTSSTYYYVPTGSKAAYREILVLEGEPNIIEY